MLYSPRKDSSVFFSEEYVEVYFSNSSRSSLDFSIALSEDLAQETIPCIAKFIAAIKAVVTTIFKAIDIALMPILAALVATPVALEAAAIDF